ncbi:glycerate kinase [Saccharopolyspora mangrovi]|uniref:glycerate kinase n=1 Tax=Saccharopolyspora mangrovi TaxID=3082379 RepID=UPI00389A9751
MYSADEVGAAIGRGLADGGAHPVLVPVADGGEGTIEVLTGGRRPARLAEHRWEDHRSPAGQSVAPPSFRSRRLGR